MDTLDKFPEAQAKLDDALASVGEGFAEIETEADELVDEVVEETEAVVRKVDWRRLARYAAAGLTVAGLIGAYAYWQNHQRKPETRLARLKRQLGLAHVDFRNLKATIEEFDFEELDRSRRKLGTYAKEATHVGAKKVAELTR